jgi:FMN phosphatase YigB (HAD superfamily)
VSAIRSFDVFDTVLTRTIGAPHALIRQLADDLHRAERLPGTAAAFVAARLRVEGALTTSLGRPVTIAEIYAGVARALSADPAKATEWARAECELERELVVAMPGARALVGAEREAHGPVIFVSDTPYDETFIRELLDRAGLCQPGDRVFTSADRGHSKSAGGLFRAVGAELGDTAASFLHVGDNPRADLAAPRTEGWDSRLRAAGALTRYERTLEDHAGAVGPAASWLAGSSRLARLEALETGTSEAIAAVAGGVLGPLLVGYALWVGAQARQRGIRRLYFVARDGQLMMRAAAPVLARLAPELECRYLYGSRQPWMLAGAQSDDLLRRWLTVTSDFTVRTTLARVDLTPEQAYAISGDAMVDPAGADRPLSADERAQLADLLLGAPLVELVRSRVGAAAHVATAYLRQEGFADAVPSGLVDAGWNGTTAAAFDRILASAGCPPVEHLFLGTTAKARTAIDDGHHLTAWLADGVANPSVVNDFPGLNVLIEMFCAGTEGRLLTYRQDDTGAMAPVLSQPANDPPLAWGLRQMQSIAVRVAELAAPHLDESSLHADTTAMTWAVLRQFWITPTRAEATAWGTFPWEEEIWPPFSPIAHPVTTREVVRRWQRGDHRLRRNNSWRAGSALVSNPPWRWLLTARAWQDQHEERLRRIPRRLRLEVARRQR